MASSYKDKLWTTQHGKLNTENNKGYDETSYPLLWNYKKSHLEYLLFYLW